MRKAPNELPVLALGPATALIVFVIVLPQLLLLRFSLNRFDPVQLMVEAVTLDNYVQALTDPFYLSVLTRTFAVSAICVLICLVLGFPLAYTISRTQSRRMKELLFLILITPLLIGNAARTIGWIVMLGEGGAINSTLRATGLIETPLQLMHTTTGVIIGLVSILLPYMVVAIQSVIDGIDPALEEAASGLGAGSLTMARRILVPLAMPGIFAGTILTLVLGMGAYATPVFIGGPAFHMMAPKIYEQIVRANNWPMGATLSFMLLLLSVVVTIVATKTMQKWYGRL
ncbi:ABC transporter permease [Chelatococcus sp. GCM10030263]|uniref:ABC transporter permease n=1 Tax=Chelatococcus sp. GCM10030263 TaxID=3273387 RepID=UPI0036238742